MNIAGVEIGPGHPCRTVAELSNASNGDLDRALRICEAAREAGADFLKLQCYSPQELVELRGDGPAPEPWGSNGWTMRRLYEKAATPYRHVMEVAKACDDIGLPWFSSVFGAGSLALLEALDCPAYKLAALDYDQRKLRKMVEGTGKPVLRSSPHEKPPAGFALWCPPGYPQTSFNLREAMKRYPGFSYHGTDPFVPALAAAYGAQLVEVHFQLNDEPSELEANVSLTASQFRDMVGMIRRAEAVAT